MSIKIININTWRNNIALNPKYIDQFNRGDIIEIVGDNGAILERRIVKFKKIFDYYNGKDK